jgi:hypothetical protein
MNSGLSTEVCSAELAAEWLRHMKAGDFASAWKVSDLVLAGRDGRCPPEVPRHYQWVWDGSPLEGKRVLIRCYHGLGDTVQFIRFARRVRAIAREVIVWAQPELLGILKTAKGIDRLLPLHDGAPDVVYDVDVESMELAHIFRVTPEMLPADVPYLEAEPARLKPLIGGGRKLNVGIVWQAGEWNRGRSIAVEALTPLMRLAHVNWYVLQRGPAAAEWPFDVGVRANTGLVEITASLMRALDLVITTDSFPAHLAGALGVPTWLLLHTDADWRWMEGRADSPWYPTMQIFRQRRSGDWPSVIDEVAAELNRRLVGP